jgi:hypothetical protein
VLSDCWRAEERGKAIAIYSLAPFIGPVVGPIGEHSLNSYKLGPTLTVLRTAGGYITQHTTWRWIFWSSSLADALVQILGVLFLQETYAPAILAKKARRLRQSTGNFELHTKYEEPNQTLGKLLRKNLVRPFRMLLTQPAIQVMAIYRAYLYGVMYLV